MLERISPTQRAPTPDPYAWHRQAIAGRGQREPIADEPRCGWFKRKFVQGGPFVPARIWLVQDVGEDGELLDVELLQCEVNGAYADPVDQWSYLCGQPITEAEFRYMEATRQWAEQHAPDHPQAKPRERINLLTTPIRF